MFFFLLAQLPILALLDNIGSLSKADPLGSAFLFVPKLLIEAEVDIWPILHIRQ
jgi:hypothetical protein